NRKLQKTKPPTLKTVEVGLGGQPIRYQEQTVQATAFPPGITNASSAPGRVSVWSSSPRSQPRACTKRARSRSSKIPPRRFHRLDVYRFTQDAIDLDELRARLRKMTDAELFAFAKAA